MTSTKKRAIAVVSAVAVVLAAAVFVVVLWPDSHKATPPHVAVLAQPEPIVSTPTPSPTVPKPAPIAHVPAAAPTAFHMIGKGFRIDAGVCGMAYVRPLDPPGDQLHTVCWVQQDFGVAPGSPSAGTTYVLGHAWAQQQLVLNPMSEFATAHVSATPHPVNGGVVVYDVAAMKGYRVELDTPAGNLVYRVTSSFLVAKNDAGLVQSVMDQSIRNRLVIITCAVKDGVDLDQNVIAYATLVRAVRG